MLAYMRGRRDSSFLSIFLMRARSFNVGGREGGREGGRKGLRFRKGVGKQD
jgi:hypothetical protein